MKKPLANQTTAHQNVVAVATRPLESCKPKITQASCLIPWKPRSSGFREGEPGNHGEDPDSHII